MFNEIHYAIKQYLSGNIKFSEFKREKPPYAEVVENLNDKCTITYVDYGNDVNITVTDDGNIIQASINKKDPKYPKVAYLTMKDSDNTIPILLYSGLL